MSGESKESERERERGTEGVTHGAQEMCVQTFGW